MTVGGVTQSEQFTCLDFADDIHGRMSWQARVTSLLDSNFSST